MRIPAHFPLTHITLRTSGRRRPPLCPILLPRIRAVGCVLVFLAAMICIGIQLDRDQRQFDRIAADLFHSEMLSNTLNMHYTIAFPSGFGIDDYQVVLPCYTGEDPDSRIQTENLLSRLKELNISRLSEDTQFTHSLLTSTLESALALSEFPYYEEPLAPSSGMQSQLPILLAEYTFRSKRDVEDYLKLLDQTDEYFQGLLTYEQEKADAGLLMPSASLKKVIKQCDTILEPNELTDGTHFLQTTFAERLEGLIADGVIGPEDAKRYQAQNDRLLRTVMQPAYEALGDGLLILEDPSVPVAGLASKPEGTAYYEQLLISQTGSYRSVTEIKEMVLAQFDYEYLALKEILTDHPRLATATYSLLSGENFPYDNAAGMLADLQQRMEDFPPLDTNEPLPSVAIKPVSASLRDYCAPAFYLTPPLDDTSSNAIYINEKSTPVGLELYTTLAHEGYPGHMYQSVYHNRSAMKSGSDQGSPVRELLWYGGYLEGWALYVEFLAYDYACDLYAQQDPAADLQIAAVELTRHDRSLMLSLYSLLDILIHYENASPEQVSELLAGVGITNKASANAVYEYIVEEPTNYLKYYLGYLEILELKKQAKELWGESYSDYRFHTFYLDCGPADFRSLAARLGE